jgi:DNA-binding protein H-NS
MTDLTKLTAQELEALAEKAKKLAVSKKEESKREVREKVLAIIRESGFSFEDIFPGNASPKGARAPLKAKYKNPADPSQTWTGRGRKPRWLVQALAEGRSMEEFAV